MSGARLALAAALFLAACDGGETGPPSPVRMSEEVVGHYCGMFLTEHSGPKGQIRLASRAEPLWFSSAHGAIAFTRMPLEPRDIMAVYVSDMARAPSWQEPGPENWIAAADAWFVIGSGRRGGMGGTETVPFGSEETARDFAAREGGTVVRLDAIPDAYVLSGADAGPIPSGGGPPSHVTRGVRP